MLDENEPPHYPMAERPAIDSVLGLFPNEQAITTWAFHGFR
jgi:hypothetical protein